MFQVTVPCVRAKSIREALAMAADGGRILAGGTDVLVLAKENMITSERLIDISSIPELRGIEINSKKIIIGAAVSLTEVMTHPLIRAEFPALVMACDVFASPQIRNRATLAGNIANASPAGDTIPALYAYDAIVQIRGRSSGSPGGRRSVPATEFVSAPRRTALEPGDLITEIVLPRTHGTHKGMFIKIGQRKSLAISKTMVAVATTEFSAGTIKHIGIALGAVAPTIIRLPDAEALLTGKKVTRELARQARAFAEAAVRPIDDIRSTADYRRKVSGVIVERGLLGLRILES
ncbi:MAG: xanthine dehydrogenase family protein subunit M [Candidatus Hydrogenedentota bacterium]